MDIVEWSRPGVKRHPWELARFEVLYGLFEKAVPCSASQKLVVDIGCGDGWFAEKLLERRKDITVIGIDPAYTEADIVKRNASLPENFQLVRTMEEATVTAKGDQAAAIFLFDVVEHIADDRTFLREVAGASFFDRHTSLLISVPAFASLFTQHDVFLQHYRRYNAATLEHVIMKAGLLPQRTAYFFCSLLPLRWWEKRKEARGAVKKQEGIGNWKGSKVMTAVITGALLADYQISKLLGKTGLRLPGLSLYCICKKPA